MLFANRWEDYHILDCGDGEKLERWGEYVLRRPDPQVIWPKSLSGARWNDVHAVYHRSSKGGGFWENKKKLPSEWTIDYMLAIGEKLTFSIEPTGFKHTGLFPEQAANWDWMSTLISGEVERLKCNRGAASGSDVSCVPDADDGVRVLNLFAYTGGATVACAAAGAKVCHVDASKGMVGKAKVNASLSGLENAPIRYIVDDVKKFVQREIRRGNKYDGIILDPPSYGRGPKGELWHLEDELFGLIDECTKVVSDRPLFFLINSYTTGLAPSVSQNILMKTFGERFKGKVKGRFTADELMIPIKESELGLALPCGSSARWQRED